MLSHIWDMIVQFMEKEKDMHKYGEITQLVHLLWELLLSQSMMYVTVFMIILIINVKLDQQIIGKLKNLEHLILLY